MPALSRTLSLAATLPFAVSTLHAGSFLTVPATTLGGNRASIEAVSGDGLFLVGSARKPGGTDVAIRSSFLVPPLDTQILGDLPGSVELATAKAVSADGSVVVGQGFSGNGTEAFIWTDAAGMLPLGDLDGGGFSSKANGVSADGSVIVGEGLSTNIEAFRWTQADGFDPLGFLPGGTSSGANAVSRDGSVVVGFSTGTSGIEAASWTNGAPAVGLDTPGSLTATISARAVSDDGTVIVGEGIRAFTGAEAFRWTTQDGAQGLGDLDGGNFASEARGVSGDGEVVVGKGTDNSGDQAFIWDPDQQMRSVVDVLQDDFAINVVGVTLTTATAVSRDGRVVVGNGLDSQQRTFGWAAYLAAFWTGTDNNNWDHNPNWLGLRPMPGEDAVIRPATGLTIQGPASLPTDIGALVVGARVSGRAVLQLNQGTITAQDLVTIESSGGLSGAGSLTAHDGIDNHGQIALDAGGQTQGGQLTNHGLVIAGGEIFNPILNTPDGEVRALTGQSVRFHGTANTNQGRINLLGGHVEFTQPLTNSPTGRITGRGTLTVAGGLVNQGEMLFSGGFADVFGDLVMTGGVGTVVATSGGVTTFFDQVEHNGESIHASTDTTITFLDDVTGAGSFTGSGTINFEAGYFPGNSPGSILFNGDVVLGPAALIEIELAGILAGSGYDHLTIAGALHADGTLALTLLDGYHPQPGDRFDLLDFDTLSGGFHEIRLPTLADGLSFDTTSLTVDGSVTVTPEPGSLAGLCLLWVALPARTRRKRSDRGRPPVYATNASK